MPWIPLAVYTDRHAVFQHNRALWAEQDQTSKRIPTQFARALQELGVTQIFAHSPQAKGRVERVNGTFQDRLVSELRLARAATIAEANAVLAAFLPRFNARFCVPAAQPGSAYRSLAADLDLASTLCIKHQRRVAKDNTVLYQQHTLQLFPTPDHLSYAGATVQVQERLDGQLVVCFQGRVVASRTAPPHARLLRGRGVVGMQNGPGVPSALSASRRRPFCSRWMRLGWPGIVNRSRRDGAGPPTRPADRPPTRFPWLPNPSGLHPGGTAYPRWRTLRPAGAQELAMGYNTLKRLLSSEGSTAPLTKSLDNSP